MKFQFGNGMDNHLPADSFDCVWVMESSHLMERKDVLLAECARVLRPDGRLVLCDIIVHNPLPLLEVVKYAREFLLLDRVFGRAKMETLDLYRNLAQANGLFVESAADISANVRPTFAAERERPDLSEASRGVDRRRELE